MTKEELAEWLHDTYKDEARKIKWKPQAKCRFDKLPKKNKQVMLNVADRLLWLIEGAMILRDKMGNGKK